MPRSGYTGDDSFTYYVCDNIGTCSSATATLIQPDSPPVGAGDSYTGLAARHQDAPGVLANDSDPDGDSFSLGYAPWVSTVMTPPQHRTLTLNSDGSFSYSPNLGYIGNDSFNYYVCDSVGTCGAGTVTLIHPNTPPVGSGEFYSLKTSLSVVAPGVLANDSDPEGDSLTTGNSYNNAIVTPPQHGTVNRSNGGSGDFSYAPNTGYAGYDSFDYYVCDSLSSCPVETVTELKIYFRK